MPSELPLLDDGRYDALVVDATPYEDAEQTGCRIELTIVAGPRKGEVVSVRAAGMSEDRALGLLGVPATITVAAGIPKILFEL